MAAENTNEDSATRYPTTISAFARDYEIDADSATLARHARKVRVTEENIKKLISRFGIKDLTEGLGRSMTILHKSVDESQTSCVKLLFESIIENKIDASLSYDTYDGPLNVLGMAIKNEALDLAEYILTVLVEECPFISVCFQLEVMGVLHGNFDQLLSLFPRRMEQYFINDSLCFEAGRFSVPRKYFDARNGEAVVHSTYISYGNEMGRMSPREYWNQIVGAESDDLNDTTGGQITAVFRVFGVKLRRHALYVEPRSLTESDNVIIPSMVAADLSVEVFNCEAIKTMVNYLWNKEWKHRMCIAFTLHVLATLFLTLYAVTYGLDSENTNDNDLKVARVSLAICYIFYTITWAMSVQPKYRRFFLGLQLGLLLSSYSEDHHTGFSAFATSIACLESWMTVLWYLQPFEATGPLISMVGYVLRDVAYFVLLMLLMMIGFGMALFVLFSDAFATENEELFKSPWRSFESVFYALLGEFDSGVIRSDLDGFVPIWRNLVFNVFLFLGPIVLLSFLISILGDTYDRVKLTEDAELIKCRARIISGCVTKKGYEVTSEMCCEGMKRFPWLCWCLWPFALFFSIRVHCLPTGDNRSVFYYLIPAEPLAGTKPDSWEGKLKSIEKIVNRSLYRSQKRSSKRLVETNKRMERLHERVEKLTVKASVVLESLEQTLGPNP